MTALASIPSRSLAALGEMSVQDIVDRKRKLVEVMDAVMVEGEHYGKIPGCGDKPTLYKAGAEVLATVFGLAPTFVIQETQLGGDHREYRVVCTLTHIGSGKSLGEGVGVCSTKESKYRWRRGARTCPKCNKEGSLRKSTRPGEGFYCWKKIDGCGAQFAPGDSSVEDQNTDRVENPDIADTFNTVLKMAKKRAQVDATLTATGASDILTQDLEDLPAGAARNGDAADAEFRDVPSNAPPPTPPQEQRRDPFVDIKNARSVSDLEALIPELSKLNGDLRKRVHAAYGHRKQELGAH